MRRTVLAVLGAGFLYLQLAPGSGVPSVSIWDKAAHMGLYFAFGLGVHWAWPGTWIRRLNVAMWGGMVVAVVLETSQRWIPGRTFDPLDLVANYVGLGLAVFVIAVWRIRTRLQDR